MGIRLQIWNWDLCLSIDSSHYTRGSPNKQVCLEKNEKVECWVSLVNAESNTKKFKAQIL